MLHAFDSYYFFLVIFQRNILNWSISTATKKKITNDNKVIPQYANGSVSAWRLLKNATYLKLTH